MKYTYHTIYHNEISRAMPDINAWADQGYRIIHIDRVDTDNTSLYAFVLEKQVKY